MMKRKKGFTLVETIVSMTLMLLIMVAAYTTILFAERTLQREKAFSFAVGEIENLLHCYQSGGFDEAVEFVYGIESVTDTFYFDSNGNISDADDYHVKIIISEMTNSRFKAVAYGKEGELIYEMPEYQK